MHYAIAYKNGAGQTQRSEFMPFKTDDDAISFGRRGALNSPIVEIWKGDDLLVRLVEGEADTFASPRQA